jgi:predicted ATPase
LTGDTFRLITILGPGGMGKTRLSIEVGRRLLAFFSDGVYFIPLAPVVVVDHIVTTIAKIIDFKFHSDLAPMQQLLDHLQKQHMLLIIDNFEHLLDHAGLLTDILQAAPRVNLLVTSREKLGLSGECVRAISGLTIPFAASAEIVAHDAVQLFMEAANRTTSPITDDDLQTIANICQMLGGMPLAILLAAAWLDTLSLAEIEAEIRRGLDILEAHLRDAPARHQSIEAVFDYSWDRLSAPEQAVFMDLSVFRGGFTRQAAQAVTGASVRDLRHLVNTSFLQHLPSGRYAIHELMRQYGEHKLAASGDLDTVRQKHAQYFATFIKPLGDAGWGALGDHEVLEAVSADFENVRAAWEFRVGTKATNHLHPLLEGTWVFFDNHSRSQEAVDLFEAALVAFRDDDEPDATLFRGHVMAYLAWSYSDIGLRKTFCSPLVRPTIYCQRTVVWQSHLVLKVRSKKRKRSK